MSEIRRKPWFRLWDEMLTDPKMAQLNNSQVGIWCKLLCLANQQTIRGIISFEDKNFIRMFEKILATCRKNLKKSLEKFEELGMVEVDLEEGYIIITNWNKRQFASDDVTARVLKYKKRKRLRKRSTEQNKEEVVPTTSSSVRKSSYLSNEDDSVVALDAPPPESPLTDNSTFKEMIMLTYDIDEDMLEKFLGHNGEQELADLIEYAKQYHNNGIDRQVNAALWHTLTFYDPKRGPASAKVYFRQELEERTGCLNAVTEAG